MIVSVWGNNGSGSSTLAIKLALAFAKKEKNVILVDTNFLAPQAKIWFPKDELEEHQSLSVILANNVNVELVAGKIKMVSDYLGYLGYTKGLSINAISNRDDAPSDLLGVLNSIADIVIVDCQPNITQDILSFMAVDVSDTKIISITPDLRGIAWYQSNVEMFNEKWASQNAQILKVFNKVKLNAPVDAVEKQLGFIDFFLPYYDEIEEEVYTGTMGHTKYKGRSKRYGTIVSSLADTILDFHHEQVVPVVYQHDEDNQFDEVEVVDAVLVNGDTSDTDNGVIEADDDDNLVEINGDNNVIEE